MSTTPPNQLVSTYSFATQFFTNRFQAGINALIGSTPQNLTNGEIAPRVADAINDPVPALRSFAGVFQIPPPPSWPPPPGYFSIFTMYGIVNVNGIKYQINTIINDFAARDSDPDQEVGDRNFFQSGVGAGEVNIPVAGCAIAFKLTNPDPNTGAPYGVAEPYYTAPQS